MIRCDSSRGVSLARSILCSSRSRENGAWEIVSNTIDALIQMGIKPFVLCTVGTGNYRQLKGMIEYCRDRMIGFRLSPVRTASTYKLPGFQDQLADKVDEIYSWVGETYTPEMPIERFAGFAEVESRRERCLWKL